MAEAIPDILLYSIKRLCGRFPPYPRSDLSLHIILSCTRTFFDHTPSEPVRLMVTASTRTCFMVVLVVLWLLVRRAKVYHRILFFCVA